MSKQVSKILGFSARDYSHIQAALKSTPDKRSYQRLSALSYLIQGKSISEVADLMGVSRQSIHNWINTFKSNHRPTDLADSNRIGRPHSATAITPKRILEALAKTPYSLGYQANSWTVALLAHYLSNHHNCIIEPATLRRRMKAMGLRYKRPRYVYSEKDPNRAQKKGRSSES